MFMFICSLRELWADVMIPSLHFARKVVPRYAGQNSDNFCSVIQLKPIQGYSNE